MVRAVEPEPQHVGVHDPDTVTERAAEVRDAAGVQLDGGDRAGPGGELPRQGAVTGAEFEDGPGRNQPRDARDHAPVDEEVLTEFVAAANGMAV
ncbi:hypothetical protein GCM10009609_03590 [Pseudonocardia aurantiaca]